MSGSTTSLNGFLRDTLPQLKIRAEADIEANLLGSIERLPQTNLDALACMTAGLTDEQLAAINYYAQQIHVTTASGVWLERHGSEWGILRKEATRASGELAVVVAANTTVPLGSLFQTDTRYQLHTTAVGASVAAGTIDIPVEAVAAGPEGNLAAGVVLETVSPIAGVLGAVVAVPGLAGGTSRETDEPYRGRILARIQEPPQGGAEYDYRAWMLSYPGCTRAFVAPKEQGIGTVVCRFAMDGAYPDGIPPVAEVERMAQYLDIRRPVTAEVFVYAPIPRLVDVTIRDLVPNTPLVQQAVEDELRDMLLREGEPGAVLYQSWFWEATSIASGERHHTIEEPTGNIQLAIGEMAVLGTLSFVVTP